jgi:hypothetical protein
MVMAAKSCARNVIKTLCKKIHLVSNILHLTNPIPQQVGFFAACSIPLLLCYVDEFINPGGPTHTKITVTDAV